MFNFGGGNKHPHPALLADQPKAKGKGKDKGKPQNQGKGGLAGVANQAKGQAKGQGPPQGKGQGQAKGKGKVQPKAQPGPPPKAPQAAPKPKPAPAPPKAKPAAAKAKAKAKGRFGYDEADDAAWWSGGKEGFVYEGEYAVCEREADQWMDWDDEDQAYIDWLKNEGHWVEAEYEIPTGRGLRVPNFEAQGRWIKTRLQVVGLAAKPRPKAKPPPGECMSCGGTGCTLCNCLACDGRGCGMCGRTAKRASVEVTAEARLDPEDNQPRTKAEMYEKYYDDFTTEEVDEYWETMKSADDWDFGVGAALGLNLWGSGEPAKPATASNIKKDTKGSDESGLAETLGAMDLGLGGLGMGLWGEEAPAEDKDKKKKKKKKDDKAAKDEDKGHRLSAESGTTSGGTAGTGGARGGRGKTTGRGAGRGSKPQMDKE